VNGNDPSVTDRNSPTHGRHMAHILVADDDPPLSDLVRFRLEAVGHRPTPILSSSYCER
jgi:hypothetical protein